MRVNLRAGATIPERLSLAPQQGWRCCSANVRTTNRDDGWQEFSSRPIHSGAHHEPTKRCPFAPIESPRPQAGCLYAAGGASLAAVEANAAIIYTDLGPNAVSVVDGVFDLDLNRDGSADFQLVHDVFFTSFDAGCTSTSSGSSFCESHVRRDRQSAFVRGLNANAVVADDGGLALNLSPGASISQATRQQALLAEYRFSSSQTSGDGGGTFSSKAGNFGGYDGNDLLPTRGLIGLLFDIPGGGRHAAWADVEAPGDEFSVNGLRLYGFAYETELGKSIVAGDKGAPPTVPGDTNADGKVDLADLNNVRNNFGGAGLGDTNADGTVDLQDLNAVRNNFGATSGANPVPEPPSLLLLAAGAAGLALLRRKRATHHETRSRTDRTSHSQPR